MTTDTKAQVELPSDREVSVSRVFRAPRELVYRAYTKPELVKRWLLGPPGWEMTVCEMDVLPGGAFRWRWESMEGEGEFGFHGEFLEVEPPSRIRHTQVYEPGNVGGTMGEETTLVTARFSEDDQKTTVTTVMDFGSKEARDGAMSSGMTDGMEMSYQKLDALVSEETES